jgi:Ni,Fe-hydrogenase III small subunit
LTLRGHRARLGRAFRSTPGLRPAVVAVTLCAVAGGLLNDSGVTVTGIMLAVALPVVAALALRADPVPATQRVADDP